MHAVKSYSRDSFSNGTAHSTLRLIKTTTPSHNVLKNWEQENIFFNRTDYHHSLSNKYGRYIYYIYCDSDELYYLGFICFHNAKEFPRPTTTKYTSLASAKIAAEEHYKKYFI